MAARTPEAAAPVLIELFTSQGCSSCPPADALLGELANQPGVIALAFHVDYWDSLGWRDRFEISEATPRQNRYVGALGLSSAFTPQAVVNGRSSLVGSDRSRILAALRGQPGNGSLTLRIEAGDLVADLSAEDSASDLDVNLAAYLSQASTIIGRGENSGRTLQEFNVVREFRHLGVTGSTGGRRSQYRVPLSSLPSDADRVAVFTQQQHQGAVGSAATAVLR